MESILIVVILLLTEQSVVSQIIRPGCNYNDDCSCVYQDNAIVQLKYLGDYIKNQKGYLTVTHKSKDGSGNDTYNFNPCCPFTITSDVGCDNVVACQHQYQYLYDIGSLTPGYSPDFRSNDEGNVLIIYTDKTGYWRLSMVTCICDPSYTGLPQFTSQGETTTNIYEFKMRHACCCKDTCKDGMPPERVPTPIVLAVILPFLAIGVSLILVGVVITIVHRCIDDDSDRIVLVNAAAALGSNGNTGGGGGGGGDSNNDGGGGGGGGDSNNVDDDNSAVNNDDNDRIVLVNEEIGNGS